MRRIRPIVHGTRTQHESTPTADKDKLLVGASSHYVHGVHSVSPRVRKILDEVAQRRQRDNWKWAITVGAWNIDFTLRYV